MAVSPEMIKETQLSLGKIIKKPPLTEKLLNKPPFRFLHDVFSVVIKDTGALEGFNYMHLLYLISIYRHLGLDVSFQKS